MGVLNKTIAVAYLARGADEGWLSSCEQFISSYKRNPAGMDHVLYVIFKGYKTDSDMEIARSVFNDIPYKPIVLEDNSFDIGAYIEWANMIEEEWVCVFNTTSRLCSQEWLRKLAVNLALDNVGLVGATASFESLRELNSVFPAFPNMHIRSTGFMVDRKLFCHLTSDLEITSKIDAFHFESGPNSLTRQVVAMGKDVLLVGGNGRGYSPMFWARSGTFRQGKQENLLVSDKQTRNYLSLPWGEKREFIIRTWGNYINIEKLFEC